MVSDLLRQMEEEHYERVLADLYKRRRIWRARARACRQALDSLLGSLQVSDDLPEQDPLLQGLRQAWVILQDLLAELESTSGIAEEEIVGWRERQR